MHAATDENKLHLKLLFNLTKFEGQYHIHKSVGDLENVDRKGEKA